MSHYNRPYLPSEGFQGRDWQSGRYPPILQLSYNNGHNFNSQPDWNRIQSLDCNSTNGHANFASNNSQTEYQNQVKLQSRWDVRYPAQAPQHQQVNWHRPQNSPSKKGNEGSKSKPRSRVGSTSPTRPYKKFKRQTAEILDQSTSNNTQNTQNQTCIDIRDNQVEIQNLLVHIKTESPYYRSEIQDVLFEQDFVIQCGPSETCLDEPIHNICRSSVPEIPAALLATLEVDTASHNLSAELEQNPNLEKIIGCTNEDNNDPSCEEENEKSRDHNKENIRHNIIVYEPNNPQEVSKNKNISNSTVGHNYEQLNTVAHNNPEKSTVSNKASYGATEAVRTDITPNSLILLLESGNCPIDDQSKSVSSENSLENVVEDHLLKSTQEIVSISTKAKDIYPVDNQATPPSLDNQLEERHENCLQNVIHESVEATVSSMDECQDLVEKQNSSNNENHNINSSSDESSNSNSSTDESSNSNSSSDESSNSNSDSGESSDEMDNNCDNHNTSKKSKDGSNHASSVISGKSKDKSIHSNSGDSSDESCCIILVKDNSSKKSADAKRKLQSDSPLRSILKKQRMIVEIDSTSSEDEQSQTNTATRSDNVLMSNIMSNIDKNVSSVSRTLIRNVNTSNHCKLSTRKPIPRVKAKKSLVKTSSKPKEKKIPITVSSMEKRPPIKINKTSEVSKLPISHEGKQKHVKSMKMLRVQLQKLSAEEISSFTATKTTVNKSSVLYEKDAFHQIKYFISVIEHISTVFKYKLSLITQSDDFKDLHNRTVCYTNERICRLVQIRYLQKKDEHLKITYKALSNTEFDIKKIYKEFLNFQKSSIKLDRFSIITNLDVSVEAFKNNGIKVTYSHADGYRLSVNKGHELYRKFLECLNLHNLAKLLVQCIGKQKQKNFNTELIKKYHIALVKEKVLTIHTKKNEKGRQIQIAKFHRDFILEESRLSNAARELRRHMIEYLQCTPQSCMEIVLTNDCFGKNISTDPNPIVNIQAVGQALVFRNHTQLLLLKNDLKKILGHVLEKKDSDEFRFSRQFFEGKDLPGNLKQLRMQVKNLCDFEKKDFFQFCNEKVEIKDFCSDYPVQYLPDERSKQLFGDFFKIFSFRKLGTCATVIDKSLFEINDRACMNAVLEELFTAFKKGIVHEETFVSIKHMISKQKVIQLSRLQSAMEIAFDDKVVDRLQAKLPKHGLVLYTTKSLQLASLKMKQLSATLNYTENKETFFITNKVLLEMTTDVLNALAHKSSHILIVQWIEPMEENQNQVLDVLIKLISLIEKQALNNFLKSAIIIIHENNHQISMMNVISTKITDDEHSFDLSNDSLVKLLESDNVSLQHRRLSFIKSELIIKKYIPILLESPQIISRLLAGKLSIGKDLIKPPGYKDLYFEKQIKKCVVIDPSIFHEKLEDVFMIRNIDRKVMEKYLPLRQKLLSSNDVSASMQINARYVLLGFNSYHESFFDNYAEMNQDRNVHLLRYELDRFVWEKTRGNNKDLLRNRLGNVDDLLEAQKTENVLADGSKTIIICGESGIGKSVCLYNLAKETKNLYKDRRSDVHWPVQVNLDKSHLSKHIKKDLKIALEKDFLLKFMCSYLQLDEVQSKLFDMIFHNQLRIKLVLFFDNYEALPLVHREFVIQLLQELQVSYCQKIYVTSTPNTRSELEEALGVFAYSLEFSEVEKIQFLQTYWSKTSLGDVDLINKAVSLIDFYATSKKNQDDLTTTPLHLKMLAGLFKPNDDDDVDDDDDDDYTAVTHDELYKLYIESKGLKDKEAAVLYSLRRILSDDQLKVLDLQHSYPRKDFNMPDDLQHWTFYEYLTAKWLATHKQSLDISSCINDLSNSVTPVFLKTYLTELNKNADMVNVVEIFAAKGYLNILKLMPAYCKDKLSLSTIIKNNNSNSHEVIKFLLDHYNDTNDNIMLHGEFKDIKYSSCNVVKYVNRRDEQTNETPLEVAARMENIPVACELLLKGASLNSIDKHFIFQLAKYTADEMCKTDDCMWLRPIVEKLLKLQPKATEHLSKTTEIPRLLSYFYIHGRVDLVNLLLKNDRERYNILVSKAVENKTPLDLVNASRVLNDDERLETTKYIVSNVGDDLERRNKYYLVDVLIAAAECNQERTFEYFIGKYPDKHMGFLERAMKCNRLDLIRFLMRKTERMMYPNENTALHKAVSLGVSPTTIKFLVNRGGIDNRNKFGETPLCVAFKEGQDFELVEYLIKRDAHLFATDELGLYPWCYAILEESKYSTDEQTRIMRYLQENGKFKAPDTEQKISFESDLKRREVARKMKIFQKPDDFMPNLELHIALKANAENWIKFLIRRGANVNQKEKDGRMPLHIAILFKRYELAKMLLDHGAMFNAKDKQNATPLELLSSNGDSCRDARDLKELLKMAKNLFDDREKYSSRVSRHLINCRDEHGKTLLHIAARNGSKSMIKDIIRHSKAYCVDYKDFPSLDVNARDSKTRTALNLVKPDKIDVAKELLVNGAIFEPANTPLLQSAKKLMLAVKDKDMEKVNELLKNDCLVNSRDEFGRSCLHLAAIYDCREIMEIILGIKLTDLDAVDSNLLTPLHYAVESDSIACVVLLLKAGASYDVVDKHGRKPFDSHEKNESSKLLCKIHKMFDDIKSDEPKILDNENPVALREFLTEIDKKWHVAKDIVINVVDKKKNTLLHTATRYDLTCVVDHLLRLGAIYNPKNRKRKTPESMAISTKQLFKNIYQASSKLTVSSWMNLEPELVVNFRFDDGYTILHSCVEKNKKEEVQWLIENGADVKATSCRGFKIKWNKKKYPEIYALQFEN